MPGVSCAMANMSRGDVDCKPKKDPEQTTPRGQRQKYPEQIVPRDKPSKDPGQTTPLGKPSKDPEQTTPCGKPKKDPEQTTRPGNPKMDLEQTTSRGKPKNSPEQSTPPGKPRKYPLQSIPRGKPRKDPKQTVPRDLPKKYPEDGGATQLASGSASSSKPCEEVALRKHPKPCSQHHCMRESVLTDHRRAATQQEARSPPLFCKKRKRWTFDLSKDTPVQKTRELFHCRVEDAAGSVEIAELIIRECYQSFTWGVTNDQLDPFALALIVFTC